MTDREFYCFSVTSVSQRFLGIPTDNWMQLLSGLNSLEAKGCRRPPPRGPRLAGRNRYPARGDAAPSIYIRRNRSCAPELTSCQVPSSVGSSQ